MRHLPWNAANAWGSHVNRHSLRIISPVFNHIVQAGRDLWWSKCKKEKSSIFLHPYSIATTSSNIFQVLSFTTSQGSWRPLFPDVRHCTQNFCLTEIFLQLREIPPRGKKYLVMYQPPSDQSLTRFARTSWTSLVLHTGKSAGDICLQVLKASQIPSVNEVQSKSTALIHFLAESSLHTSVKVLHNLYCMLVKQHSNSYNSVKLKCIFFLGNTEKLFWMRV